MDLKEKLINSDAQSLNLSNRNITSIESIIPYLAQLRSLRSLNLSGNKITTIPEKISVLQNLEILNIANNPFQKTPVQNIIGGLLKLKKLKHLFITVSHEVEDAIISKITSLETFNGANFYLSEYDNDQTKGNSEKEKSKTFENVKSEKYDSPKENENFEKILKLFKEIKILNSGNIDHSKIHSNALNEFDELLENSKSKLNIINYCTNELIDFFDGEKSIKTILTLIKVTYNNYITQINEEKKKVLLLLNEEEKSKKNLSLIFESKQQKLMDLNTSNLLELQKTKHLLKQYNFNAFKRPSLQTKKNPRKVLLKNLKYIKNASKKLKNSPMKKKKKGDYFRNVTFKKLKEIINSIYKSKMKYDLIAVKNKLPKMTMERYFFYHLNQKYGIKSVVLKWSKSIFEGIKQYSSIDNDVLVFSKILSNEIDEEFRFVQNQLKETVFELVKTQIKGKNPLASSAILNKMLKTKLSGFLYEEEFVDVINYMYNKIDATKVIQKVKEHIRINSDQVRIKKYKLLYNSFVTCLLNFQLESHMSFLKAFLRLFKQVDSDADGIITDFQFEKLVKLMTEGKRKRKTIQKYLKVIDKNQLNSITFSECVNFLSSDESNKELVKFMKRRKKMGKDDDDDVDVDDDDEKIEKEDDDDEDDVESYAQFAREESSIKKVEHDSPLSLKKLQRISEIESPKQNEEIMKVEKTIEEQLEMSRKIAEESRIKELENMRKLKLLMEERKKEEIELRLKQSESMEVNINENDMQSFKSDDTSLLMKRDDFSEEKELNKKKEDLKIRVVKMEDETYDDEEGISDDDFVENLDGLENEEG